MVGKLKKMLAMLPVWLLFSSIVAAGEGEHRAGKLVGPVRMTFPPGARIEGRELARTLTAQTARDHQYGRRGTAFLKSLLIPGWGQYSLGHKTSAIGFWISEAGWAGSAIAFHVYGRWLEDDYQNFAAAHAATTIPGRNSQFWVDLGNFNSVFDYNDEKLRQRNVRDLRDPEGPEFWQWDSAANRRFFEDLRIRSDRSRERSTFMVAAIIANHVASAIHAMWVHKRVTRRTNSGHKSDGLQLGVSPIHSRQCSGLRLSVHF